MKFCKQGLFHAFCVFIMCAATVFLGGITAVIMCRGSGNICSSIIKKETLFAVQISIRSACISSLLCFFFAIPTSYALARIKIGCRTLIEIILEITMSLPYIVIGLSLLIIFSSPFGKALKAAGFPVIFSCNGIIAAQLAVNLPFAVKLVSASFNEADCKLERIAGLLGATETECFFTILLPVCKNSLISAFVLVWARALGEFGATLMLVGVTRMKTETLPASIYLNVSTNNLDDALANAFILLAISAFSLGIANYLTRKNRKRSRYGM